MNIAVVDDCKEFAEGFCAFIKNYCKNQNIKYKIETYYDGYSLLENYKKYHMIFLDIDMPMLDGIKTCEKINEKRGPADIPYIIFVTGKDNMVFEALKQRPYAFIRKSELNSEVPACINAICAKLKIKNNDYTIKNGRNIAIINLNDVLYLEKDKNYVVFYTQNHTYRERSNMVQKEADLCGKGFVRINIGCIVNIKHISNFETNVLELDNGKRLVISGKFKETAKKAIMNGSDIKIEL